VFSRESLFNPLCPREGAV
jgi:hypothetical protein